MNATSSHCSYGGISYLGQTEITYIGSEPEIQVDLTTVFKYEGNVCNHTSLEPLFYNSKFS